MAAPVRMEKRRRKLATDKPEKSVNTRGVQPPPTGSRVVVVFGVSRARARAPARRRRYHGRHRVGWLTWARAAAGSLSRT